MEKFNIQIIAEKTNISTDIVEIFAEQEQKEIDLQNKLIRFKQEYKKKDIQTILNDFIHIYGVEEIHLIKMLENSSKDMYIQENLMKEYACCFVNKTLTMTFIVNHVL